MNENFITELFLKMKNTEKVQSWALDNYLNMQGYNST